MLVNGVMAFIICADGRRRPGLWRLLFVPMAGGARVYDGYQQER